MVTAHFHVLDFGKVQFPFRVAGDENLDHSLGVRCSVTSLRKPISNNFKDDQQAFRRDLDQYKTSLNNLLFLNNPQNDISSQRSLQQVSGVA